jgi:hypothetical protein
VRRHGRKPSGAPRSAAGRRRSAPSRSRKPNVRHPSRHASDGRHRRRHHLHVASRVRLRHRRRRHHRRRGSRTTTTETTYPAICVPMPPARPRTGDARRWPRLRRRSELRSLSFHTPLTSSAIGVPGGCSSISWAMATSLAS